MNRRISPGTGTRKVEQFLNTATIQEAWHNTYLGYFLYSLHKEKFLDNITVPGKTGLYLSWASITGYVVLNNDLETSEERHTRIMEFFQKTEGDNWPRQNFLCVFGKVISNSDSHKLVSAEYDFRRSFFFDEKEYTVNRNLL